MALEALKWYRVKDTGQFCQVTGIASTADPNVRVRKADRDLNSFHAYLLWFTPSADGAWTKRAILMDLPKALRLLRDPAEEDGPTIENLRSISKDLPLSSATVDGIRTEPAPD